MVVIIQYIFVLNVCISYVLEFIARLVCASSLFKWNVSSLFPVIYAGSRYKLQFKEYGSFEGDAICVCVLLNLRYF